MNLKDLLKIIIGKEASDLHVASGIPPYMRLNGLLVEMDPAPLSSAEIHKMLEGVMPEGRRLPALGDELDCSLEMKGVARFRINVFHDHNGLSASFRLVPACAHSLEQLGLPQAVGSVADMKSGLVLVTGITGSGKTTTLAAIIELINLSRRDHIITIEDPIEYVYTPKKCIINQREVGLHTRSFHGALRAALREDPDVILVGELRDLETISMAITAAETGHLVLATLHTRGSAQSIDRMIDIFPSHQQEQVRIQLADALEMVISQVLLPACDRSRRHLACEVMVATTGVRQLIRTRKTHLIANEIETGAQYGMQTLEKSLKALVNTGQVSMDMALPWVRDKKYFEST